MKAASRNRNVWTNRMSLEIGTLNFSMRRSRQLGTIMERTSWSMIWVLLIVQTHSQVAVEYFSNMFKSSNPTDLPDFFDGFQPRVTSRMNEELTREVSKEEMKRAAFAIKAASAPRRMECRDCSFRGIGMLLGQEWHWRYKSFSR